MQKINNINRAKKPIILEFRKKFLTFFSQKMDRKADERGVRLNLYTQ
jgi:hypothetical protein